MIAPQIRRSSSSAYLFTKNPSLLLHFFSTSTKKEPKPVSEFPPTQNPIPVQSFLKKHGFSDAQLEKILKSRHQLNSANVETSIKPKIDIFKDSGFSDSEIAEIITKEPRILCSSTTKLLPSILTLRDILGPDSHTTIMKIYLRSGWYIVDMEKLLRPNMEICKSRGIPMEHILFLLCKCPRTLLVKPQTLKQHTEKLVSFGMDPKSKMYAYALRISLSITNEAWETKLRTFSDLGFSQNDILTMFKRAPNVFGRSIEKIKGVVEAILGTEKYDLRSIVCNPTALSCSVDKRLKPRFDVLEVLEKRGRIENWPGLGVVYSVGDERFHERFVVPYVRDVREPSSL